VLWKDIQDYLQVIVSLKSLRKKQKLCSARKEVDINAGGTSGYIVKHGPNKDKVLAHTKVKSTNNW